MVASNDIDELLSQHAKGIDELRGRCKDILPDPEIHDDIFLLRYVLSFGNEAETNLRFAMKWREEHEDELRRALDKDIDKLDIFDRYTSHVRTRQRNGGPIIIVRAKYARLAQLMDAMSVEQLILMATLMKEQEFRICDALTRKTRKLVKFYQFMDLTDASGANMFSKKFMAGMGGSSKLSAALYPQLLGGAIMCNPPTWIGVMLKMARAFVSKSTYKKIRPASNSGKNGRVDLLSGNPWMAEIINEQDLPDFMGGGLKVPPYEYKEDPREYTELTVAARSAKTVTCKVAKGGSAVDWAVNLRDKGVNMAISIKDKAGEVHILAEEVKIKADDGIAGGVLICKYAGTLTLSFDNTYSMLRSKTLSYSIEVTAPQVVEGDEEVVSLSSKVEQKLQVTEV